MILGNKPDIEVSVDPCPPHPLLEVLLGEEPGLIQVDSPQPPVNLQDDFSNDMRSKSQFCTNIDDPVSVEKHSSCNLNILESESLLF